MVGGTEHCTCFAFTYSIFVCFAVKPAMPDNFEEVTWEKLQDAVDAIHSSFSIRYSLEELYQAVENMCTYKMATGLYSQLQTRCQKHVRASLGQFLAETLDYEQFLKLIDNCWQNHCRQMVRGIYFLSLSVCYMLFVLDYEIWTKGSFFSYSQYFLKTNKT